jgi:hypothetical protein
MQIQVWRVGELEGMMVQRRPIAVRKTHANLLTGSFGSFRLVLSRVKSCTQSSFSTLYPLWHVTGAAGLHFEF